MKQKNSGLFFSLFLLVYILLLLLSFVGALAPFIDVSLVAIIQFLPVGIAFLIPAHLFAIFYFARHSRFLVLLALLVLGACIWVGHKDIRIPTDEHPSNGDLSVVSFNVRTFEYQTAKVDSTAKLLQSMNADVVCMQEFRNHNIGEDQKADSYLAQKLGLKYYKFIALPVHIHGVVIFSRYPILSIDTLYISAKGINSGILMTLQSPKGKIGIANLHLSSFNIEGEMKEHEGWRDRLLNIPGRLAKVIKSQQEKVNIVQRKIKDYPYPLVIAADMNSAPHTRITSQFSNQMNDSFTQKGKGIGWTYPLLGPLGVRIDYLFSSPELTILKHDVIPSSISDHYPIVASYLWEP